MIQIMMLLSQEFTKRHSKNVEVICKEFEVSITNNAGGTDINMTKETNMAAK